jgi:AcrR family transcriptional regulator
MSQQDGATFATKSGDGAMSKAAVRQPAASRSAARGEVVVRAVIRATFEELAEVGYAALSIDDVARRAGVNKTTVYRRWPTKEDLVTAALLALPEEYFTMPNTGTIRGDLIEIAGRVARIFQAVEGRAMMRIVFFEGKLKLTQLTHVDEHFAARREATGMPAILNRAIARGQLPIGFNQQMLTDILLGTICTKVLTEKVALGKAFVAQLVDVVLAGMLSCAPGARASSVRPLGRARATGKRHAS